jgi:hypothetical protein
MWSATLALRNVGDVAATIADWEGHSAAQSPKVSRRNGIKPYQTGSVQTVAYPSPLHGTSATLYEALHTDAIRQAAKKNLVQPWLLVGTSFSIM